MNQKQLALVPDHLLARRRTADLMAWLHIRGWHMTLLELENLRRERREARRC